MRESAAMRSPFLLHFNTFHFYACPTSSLRCQSWSGVMLLSDDKGSTPFYTHTQRQGDGSMKSTSTTSGQSGSTPSAALSRRTLLRGSALALAAGAAALVDESAHAQESTPPAAMRSPQHQ